MWKQSDSDKSFIGQKLGIKLSYKITLEKL
jgi:hypothetical protein